MAQRKLTDSNNPVWLHAMIGEQFGEGAEDVVVGIETDRGHRGPWVQALIAAAYTAFAINPLLVARYRQLCGI